VSTGKGSISTERKNIVAASWTLRCIKVNNQPDSQLLKFVIDLIDGKAVEVVGFTALFRQTGTTEILNINTLSVPEIIAANPNSPALIPAGEDEAFEQYSIEDDMAELDWMYAQLHELKLMISEKKHAIAAHAYEYPEDFEEDIRECDSLKCVATHMVEKVKHTAHTVYRKLAGEDVIYDEEFGHFPKPPFKKPHWPKIPFHPGKGKHGKHGNHTCGPPSNGTGNHTHPHPPHWRKPHHFLPICRLPPHHKPPHHKPPHHEPPHHGPPHHGPPPHGKPPGDDQNPFHDGPEDDGRAPHPHAQHEEDGPPPPPPHLDFGPPHHGEGPIKALKIVKYSVIGFLLAFLVIALHRRGCTPTKRAERKALREECRRRRAFRRAAHKHIIRRFLSRISGNGIDDESTADYEEKREQLLSESEDDLSTTMTEEIVQFRNAASVVDDMVSAEEGRARTVAYVHGHQPEPIPIPAREESALMRGYDIGSQVGDGEELPAYEDHDGSEMSSVIADGFRYTPGSSEYSPQQSASGSVSDILGPDTKT
jgi:hypothetical protein